MAALNDSNANTEPYNPHGNEHNMENDNDNWETVSNTLTEPFIPNGNGNDNSDWENENVTPQIHFREVNMEWDDLKKKLQYLPYSAHIRALESAFNRQYINKILTYKSNDRTDCVLVSLLMLIDEEHFDYIIEYMKLYNVAPYEKLSVIYSGLVNALNVSFGVHSHDNVQLIVLLKDKSAFRDKGEREYDRLINTLEDILKGKTGVFVTMMLSTKSDGGHAVLLFMDVHNGKIRYKNVDSIFIFDSQQYLNHRSRFIYGKSIINYFTNTKENSTRILIFNKNSYKRPFNPFFLLNKLLKKNTRRYANSNILGRRMDRTFKLKKPFIRGVSVSGGTIKRIKNKNTRRYKSIKRIKNRNTRRYKSII